MPIQLRPRKDSWYIAETKAKRPERVLPGESIEWCSQEQWDATPPAQAGDCWRTRWALGVEERKAGLIEGPIAGYAICCIKCGGVHCWTTATNCGTKREKTGTNPDGSTFTYTSCDHSGTGSCWQWSGSLEDGTLDAKPSLHCQLELGGCGYHGWLNSGTLTDG